MRNIFAFISRNLTHCLSLKIFNFVIIRYYKEMISNGKSVAELVTIRRLSGILTVKARKLKPLTECWKW